MCLINIKITILVILVMLVIPVWLVHIWLKLCEAVGQLEQLDGNNGRGPRSTVKHSENPRTSAGKVSRPSGCCIHWALAFTASCLGTRDTGRRWVTTGCTAIWLRPVHVTQQQYKTTPWNYYYLILYTWNNQWTIPKSVFTEQEQPDTLMIQIYKKYDHWLLLSML